jgi:hypothetical protein
MHAHTGVQYDEVVRCTVSSGLLGWTGTNASWNPTRLLGQQPPTAVTTLAGQHPNRQKSQMSCPHKAKDVCWFKSPFLAAWRGSCTWTKRIRVYEI